MTDYTPAGRVGKLVVRGRKLKRDVAEAVLVGTLEMTTDQVTQLTITLEDADDRLLASRLFDAGCPVDYAGLKLEVAALGTGEDSGVHTLEVEARALGAQKMRRAKGPLVERRLSPTDYMRRRAKAAGLTFVGQPSATRRTIRRKTGDAESDYDTGARLAGELGYLAYEAAGTYYFGRPTWLRDHVTTHPVKIGPNTPGVLARPVCRRSVDNPKAVTVDLEVDDTLGDTMRPGMAIDVVDVPTFTGRYLIDTVTIPLDDTQPVTVAASTAINPPLDTASTSTTDDGTRTGGPTSAAFAGYALEQAGDAYVFGAEASLTDPDPDAFDCSELVQWAAARAGVTVPDGSAAQLAYCQRKGTTISVDTAVRTRGALLFQPGHVEISLGNGRTIAAVNRTYGVRQMSATARSVPWTAGARVPGLTY